MIRLKLVDVLRQRVGKVCVCVGACAAVRLAQPTVSHHLKVLRDAGLVDSERARPVGGLLRQADALDELSGWLR